MSTKPDLAHLDAVYQPLRLTYGLVPLLAGLDKFLGLLADWPAYLSPSVAALVPLSDDHLLQAVGIVEIAVGLMVLTRWTRLGAWIAMAWLILIALNLATIGALDIAVRDLAMAVGAYSLARLSTEREQAAAPATAASAAVARP